MSSTPLLWSSSSRTLTRPRPRAPPIHQQPSVSNALHLPDVVLAERERTEYTETCAQVDHLPVG